MPCIKPFVTTKHTIRPDIRAFIEQNTLENGTGRGKWERLEEVNEVVFEYRRLRSNIDRYVAKPSYIMIGATGGIGVIVLAISIFWGLKSSDVPG